MERKTQVLVVGAGPVGLLAALRLKQRGLDVTVADQNERNTARSFAVVLHARTLAMLGDLGLFEPFVWQGQSFKRIVVFSGGERRAILDVPTFGELAEGGLTLPQNVLRNALELALQKEGVYVEYLHRLTSLRQDDPAPRAAAAAGRRGGRRGRAARGAGLGAALESGPLRMARRRESLAASRLRD